MVFRQILRLTLIKRANTKGLGGRDNSVKEVIDSETSTRVGQRQQTLWDLAQARDLVENRPKPETSTGTGLSKRPLTSIGTVPRQGPPQGQVHGGATTEGAGLSWRPMQDWA